MADVGALATIGEIDARLGELSPVRVGFRRVLRGQANLHPLLLPAEYRSKRHPKNRLLQIASHAIIESLGGDSIGDVRSLRLWTDLIAQQYGPGSPYLDVTDNLDVALWFALHRFASDAVAQWMGSSGPIDTATDLVATIDALVPMQISTSHGFLVVMDVPVSSGPMPKRHGELIDLSELPAPLADSLRIQNQHASLVWSDKDEASGDLSQFIVGDSIEVSAELLNDLDTRLPARVLFPHPQEDPWYHTLQPTPGEDELSLQQTVPVPLYIWDADSAQKVTESIISLDTPITAADLRDVTTTVEGEARLLFADNAVAILAEEPFYLQSAAIDSPMWSLADAVDATPHFATVTNPLLGEEPVVSLDRVYFEFSPLELQPWDRIETSGFDVTFHSGAYIERRADAVVMWRTERILPSGARKLRGPTFYKFDVSLESFQVSADGEAWFDAHLDHQRLKTLIVCLNLLRPLSQPPIIDAHALWLVDDRVRVSALVGGAQLRRATFKGETVYLLRRPGSDDLYGKDLKLGVAIDNLPLPPQTAAHGR